MLPHFLKVNLDYYSINFKHLTFKSNYLENSAKFFLIILIRLSFLFSSLYFAKFSIFMLSSINFVATSLMHSFALYFPKISLVLNANGNGNVTKANFNCYKLVILKNRNLRFGLIYFYSYYSKRCYLSSINYESYLDCFSFVEISSSM